LRPFNFLRRWRDEFEADHDGLNLWGWTWDKSEDWDIAHANRSELWDREPDVDRLREAGALSKAKDYTAAIQIWRELAELGSVIAMLDLGQCYEKAVAGSQDLDKAEYWYKRAFACGSQRAMVECAHFAASRKDYAACEAILQVGVEEDWTPALFWLAWYRHKQSESKETYRAIFPMLAEAARRGHPAARLIFANFMTRGRFGLLHVPRGFFRSMKFLWTIDGLDGTAKQAA